MFRPLIVSALLTTLLAPGCRPNYEEMAEEAAMNLRRLFDSSVSYYDTPHTDNRGTILSIQFPTSVPLTPAEIPCGEEYVPTSGLWDVNTWESLNFAMSDPFRYSYQYDSSGTGYDATFTASAFGNLDCDDVYSTFTRVGYVENGEIRGGGGILVDNPLE